MRRYLLWLVAIFNSLNYNNVKRIGTHFSVKNVKIRWYLKTFRKFECSRNECTTE